MKFGPKHCGSRLVNKSGFPTVPGGWPLCLFVGRSIEIGATTREHYSFPGLIHETELSEASLVRSDYRNSVDKRAGIVELGINNVSTGLIDIAELSTRHDGCQTVDEKTRSLELRSDYLLPVLSMYPHFVSIRTAAKPSENVHSQRVAGSIVSDDSLSN